MANNLTPESLRGWHVAVLDDDPASLEIVRTVLEHYDVHVHEAVNGEDGLALIDDVRPRFVVCDLDMPLLNGWGVVEAMKKNRALSGIPVIALTASSSPGDRSKAIAAGFHNYLTKPLTPSTFVNDLLLVLDDAGLGQQD